MERTPKSRAAIEALRRMQRSEGVIRPTAKMIAARETLARIGQQLDQTLGLYGAPASRPAKMQAARDALKRQIENLRLQFQGTRKQSLAKKLLARLAFEDCYIANREELRRSQRYEPLSCVSNIDRVVATASDLVLGEFDEVSGYEIGKARPLWNQSYRTATPIKGGGSVRQLTIESGPAKPCYPRYRIAIEPRDSTGLEAQDLALILKRLTNPKLQLVEVAFDFPFETVVDTEFVERHGVFGKSEPRCVGKIPVYDSWGSRKGSKLVKSYYKAEICVHRLELEFHAPDLRHYGITDIVNFQKFATLLPGHHIYFGQIDHGALVRRLVTEGFTPEKVREIRSKVRRLEWNLSAALSYLRRTVGLTNARRLLTPLEEVNLVDREALEKWAAKWRTAIVRLRTRP